MSRTRRLGTVLLLAVAAPPLTRASITIEDVRRSIDDEKVITERADRLPRPGEPWFAVLAVALSDTPAFDERSLRSR